MKYFSALLFAQLGRATGKPFEPLSDCEGTMTVAGKNLVSTVRKRALEWLLAS
jgi:hypothetical protein